jgi:NDP-sugar pyrophosphorylase family protein
LKDWAIIGENTQLEERVEIRRSILWENVIVKKGIRVIDSIVTSLREVKSDLIDKIF